MLGEVKPAQVTTRQNGLYDVEYTCDAEGPCRVDVSYAGYPVPNRSAQNTAVSANKCHSLRCCHDCSLGEPSGDEQKNIWNSC